MGSWLLGSFIETSFMGDETPRIADQQSAESGIKVSQCRVSIIVINIFQKFSQHLPQKTNNMANCTTTVVNRRPLAA